MGGLRAKYAVGFVRDIETLLLLANTTWPKLVSGELNDAEREKICDAIGVLSFESVETRIQLASAMKHLR